MFEVGWTQAAGLRAESRQSEARLMPVASPALWLVELEKTFLHHEAIKDVAVHSVLSEVGEDDVKVTAVLRDGVTISEVELCTWAVDHLPYFAMPRYIEFRADLPRTPSGKVQKYQLRDEGKTANTWDREASGFTFTRR